MEQHVHEATHRSGNTLDLILCDQENMISEVSTEGRMGKSDHDIVAFKLCVTKEKSTNQCMLPNYGRAIFDEIRIEMVEGKSVNENWILVRDKMKKFMSELIPMKKKRGLDEPQWMDK